MPIPKPGFAGWNNLCITGLAFYPFYMAQFFYSKEKMNHAKLA
jgi:hypothetical protein